MLIPIFNRLTLVRAAGTSACLAVDAKDSKATFFLDLSTHNETTVTDSDADSVESSFAPHFTQFSSTEYKNMIKNPELLHLRAENEKLREALEEVG